MLKNCISGSSGSTYIPGCPMPYNMNAMSCYNRRPTYAACKAVLHILRYVSSTRDRVCSSWISVTRIPWLLIRMQIVEKTSTTVHIVVLRRHSFLWRSLVRVPWFTWCAHVLLSHAIWVYSLVSQPILRKTACQACPRATTPFTYLVSFQAHSHIL